MPLFARLALPSLCLAIPAAATNCPAGSFSNGTGCSHCPSGYYQPDANQGDCDPCSRGKYAKEGVASGARTTMSSSCEVCPAGQYQDQKHATECIACPAGKYNYIDVTN